MKHRFKTDVELLPKISSFCRCMVGVSFVDVIFSNLITFSTCREGRNKLKQKSSSFERTRSGGLNQSESKPCTPDGSGVPPGVLSVHSEKRKQGGWGPSNLALG